MVVTLSKQFMRRLPTVHLRRLSTRTGPAAASIRSERSGPGPSQRPQESAIKAGERLTAQALETLTEFGTLVQVGMGRLEATINTYPLIINQLTVKGSKSGTKTDLEALYGLMRSGNLNPLMNLITPSGIPDALDHLRKGGVIGRYIAQYPD